jgi:hypothetical protein
LNSLPCYEWVCNAFPYLEACEDAFVSAVTVAGVSPVEELPWGPDGTGVDAFPVAKYAPKDPDGVAFLPDCGACPVAGGAVGGVVLSADGDDGVSPVVEGFAGDGTPAPSSADGTGEGLPLAVGGRVCVAGSEEIAGVAMGGGCKASTGKVIELTTEGSS